MTIELNPEPANEHHGDLDPTEALRDLLHQLEGIGIAIPGEDEGQWAGTEGLSFSRAYAVVGRWPDLD